MPKGRKAMGSHGQEAESEARTGSHEKQQEIIAAETNARPEGSLTREAAASNRKPREATATEPKRTSQGSHRREAMGSNTNPQPRSRNPGLRAQFYEMTPGSTPKQREQK